MKLVYGPEYLGVGYTTVEEGDEVISFRGEHYVVTGWREPQHAGSTGRVYVKSTDHPSSLEYFPSVFDLKFVHKDDVRIC